MLSGKFPIPPLRPAPLPTHSHFLALAFPYTLPLPCFPTHPLTLLGPIVFPVLGHIKFARPRGLSSQ